MVAHFQTRNSYEISEINKSIDKSKKFFFLFTSCILIDRFKQRIKVIGIKSGFNFWNIKLFVTLWNERPYNLSILSIAENITKLTKICHFREGFKIEICVFLKENRHFVGIFRSSSNIKKRYTSHNLLNFHTIYEEN